MFLFSPTVLTFLVFAAATVLLFGGLFFLMGRRRDELLQEYLTPEEPELEREFFQRPPEPEPEESAPVEEEAPPEQPEQLWPELPPGMQEHHG